MLFVTTKTSTTKTIQKVWNDNCKYKKYKNKQNNPNNNNNNINTCILPTTTVLGEDSFVCGGIFPDLCAIRSVAVAQRMQRMSTIIMTKHSNSNISDTTTTILDQNENEMSNNNNNNDLNTNMNCGMATSEFPENAVSRATFQQQSILSQQLLVSKPTALLHAQRGVLWKRRDVFRNSWRPRWFDLRPDQGLLTYYLLTDNCGSNASFSSESILPSVAAIGVLARDVGRSRATSWDSAVSNLSENSVDYDVVPRGSIYLWGGACTVAINETLSKPHDNLFVFTIRPADKPQQPANDSGSRSIIHGSNNYNAGSGSSAAALAVHLAARTSELREEWVRKIQQVCAFGQDIVDVPPFTTDYNRSTSNISTIQMESPTHLPSISLMSNSTFAGSAAASSSITNGLLRRRSYSSGGRINALVEPIVEETHSEIGNCGSSETNDHDMYYSEDGFMTPSQQPSTPIPTKQEHILQQKHDPLAPTSLLTPPLLELPMSLSSQNMQSRKTNNALLPFPDAPIKPKKRNRPKWEIGHLTNIAHTPYTNVPHSLAEKIRDTIHKCVILLNDNINNNNDIDNHDGYDNGNETENNNENDNNSHNGNDNNLVDSQLGKLQPYDTLATASSTSLQSSSSDSLLTETPKETTTTFTTTQVQWKKLNIQYKRGRTKTMMQTRGSQDSDNRDANVKLVAHQCLCNWDDLLLNTLDDPSVQSRTGLASKLTPQTPTMIVKTEARMGLNITAKQVFRLIVDTKCRTEYETNLQFAQRMKRFNPHTSADYYASVAVWPTAAREFAVVTHWQVITRSDGAHGILMISFSCPEVEALRPVAPHHVRGSLILSMCLIRDVDMSKTDTDVLTPPTRTGSGGPTHRCYMTRMLSMDLGGSISQHLSNVIMTQQATIPAVISDYLERQTAAVVLSSSVQYNTYSTSFKNDDLIRDIIEQLGDNNEPTTTTTTSMSMTAGSNGESTLTTAVIGASSLIHLDNNGCDDNTALPSKFQAFTIEKHKRYMVDETLCFRAIVLLAPIVLHRLVHIIGNSSASGPLNVSVPVFCISAFCAVRYITLLHLRRMHGSGSSNGNTCNDAMKASSRGARNLVLQRQLIGSCVKFQLTIDLKGILRFLSNKKEERRDEQQFRVGQQQQVPTSVPNNQPSSSITSSKEKTPASTSKSMEIQQEDDCIVADVSVVHIVASAIARALTKEPELIVKRIRQKRVKIPFLLIDEFFNDSFDDTINNDNPPIDVTIWEDEVRTNRHFDLNKLSSSSTASRTIPGGAFVTVHAVDRKNVQDVANELLWNSRRLEHPVDDVIRHRNSHKFGHCLVVRTNLRGENNTSARSIYSHGGGTEIDESRMEMDFLPMPGCGISVVASVGDVRLETRRTTRKPPNRGDSNVSSTAASSVNVDGSSSVLHSSATQSPALSALRRPVLSLTLTVIPAGVSRSSSLEEEEGRSDDSEQLLDVHCCRRYADEVHKLLLFPEMCDDTRTFTECTNNSKI